MANPQTSLTPTPFKIFGLQRTGTNLMSALIWRSFRATSLERWTAWKHGPADPSEFEWNGVDVRFVLCVRNPYVWLLACHRYFKKASGRDPTLPSQFEQRPWMDFDEFLNTACYEFRNPVDRWNRMYRHWREMLPPKYTAVVRQEDQLANQIATLERIETQLAMARRRRRFKAITQRVDIIPNYREPLNPDYYTDREFMVEYSQSQLDRVNDELDSRLMEELGYSPEQWTLAERNIGGSTLVLRPSTADAEEVVAATNDLYELEQIKRWSTRIETVVEIGSGIGTTAFLAKRYWPNCRVHALEACPEKLRLLRINARRLPGIVPLAITGPPDTGPEPERTLTHCGGEVDVLRLLDKSLAPATIRRLCASRVLDRFRWIHGVLGDNASEATTLSNYMSHSHSVEIRPTTKGQSFLARRNRAPRIRAESEASVGRVDILTEETAFDAAVRFIQSIPEYPSSRFREKGIVICAGGRHYFPCAWVCIKILRHLGVSLPIEMWAINSGELDPTMRKLVEPLGVRCVDASQVRKRYPVRLLDGWELKPYAIIHSQFKEVLFLDADNVAVMDPTVLFWSPEYKAHGALFWPAYGPFLPDDPLWRVCRVEYREEADFETGQILIDKARCWKSLQLTMHLNENSDFYYRFTQGDKETFHMAWRMMGQNYAMISTPPEKVDGAAYQHDPDGRRVFQHRYEAKWSVVEANRLIPGFVFEALCLAFLEELARSWPGR